MKLAMAWISVLLVLGCQRGEGDGGVAPAPASKYTSDIQKLCDVMTLSKAVDDPGGKGVITANWLAAHLETKEAHDFLVRISPLVGEPKAQALETEAHKVGLVRCALAAEWRAPLGG